MAVARTSPKCLHCGKPIAEEVHMDQSKIPVFQRLIGDTFIKWKYKYCNCKGAKKARKEFEKNMKKWHDEHPFDLEQAFKDKQSKKKK